MFERPNDYTLGNALGEGFAMRLLRHMDEHEPDHYLVLQLVFNDIIRAGQLGGTEVGFVAFFIKLAMKARAPNKVIRR